MEKSNDITHLAEAFAKAQGEMKAAEMTATNPFLKNRYADLGAVIQASRAVLAKHGLSVVQPISGTGDFIAVTTMLMHTSGEWIAETISLPMGEERGKSAAQVAGSTITYLRRYSLASMLGVYADEDTDGNEPAPKTNGKVAQTAPAAAAPAKMSRETSENIKNSDGTRYGDIPTEKLEPMQFGIRKGLQKPGLTQAERDAYNMKLAAIDVILTARENEDDEARAEMKN